MSHNIESSPSNGGIIRNSWDKNVLTRSEDLEQGTDFSYLNYISPWVFSHVLENSDTSSVILDIGCGCGYLTNAVYMGGRHNIRGIDISSRSIEYAQSKYPNISFPIELFTISNLPISLLWISRLNLLLNSFKNAYS